MGAIVIEMIVSIVVQNQSHGGEKETTSIQKRQLLVPIKLKKKGGTILHVPNFLLITHDKGEDHGPIFLNSRGARLTL